jgi:hypothetical protein
LTLARSACGSTFLPTRCIILSWLDNQL